MFSLVSVLICLLVGSYLHSVIKVLNILVFGLRVCERHRTAIYSIEDFVHPASRATEAAAVGVAILNPSIQQAMMTSR